MIGAHPGGLALTRRLLELAGIEEATGAYVRPDNICPIKILDLGAGLGESVQFLRELGWDAQGIDRTLKEDLVTAGDITALSLPDASYDFCLAECSFSVCGDGQAALREAYRILRPGGSLLLSDVFFQKETAPCLSMPEPLTAACWERAFEKAGFVIQKTQDETALWREFFLESLWNDNADSAFCDFFRETGKAGCGYFLAWLKKGRGK